MKKEVVFGGHFAPKLGDQFELKLGGQFDRFFHFISFSIAERPVDF